MKRMLTVVSALFAVLIASSSPLWAACRAKLTDRTVQVTKVTRVVETKTVVPFAVPVAVPVAVVSPYLYGYSQFAPPSHSTPRSHAPAWERNDSTLRVDELQIDPAVSDSRRGASPQAFLRGAWERGSSFVTQHCVTCHGGASPQGQLSLERLDKLNLVDRLAAIRAVLAGRMPKGQKLNDEQIRAIVEELAGGDVP